MSTETITLDEHGPLLRCKINRAVPAHGDCEAKDVFFSYSQPADIGPTNVLISFVAKQFDDAMASDPEIRCCLDMLKVWRMST